MRKISNNIFAHSLYITILGPALKPPSFHWINGNIHQLFNWFTKNIDAARDFNTKIINWLLIENDRNFCFFFFIVIYFWHSRKVGRSFKFHHKTKLKKKPTLTINENECGNFFFLSQLILVGDDKNNIFHTTGMNSAAMNHQLNFFVCHRWLDRLWNALW